MTYTKRTRILLWICRIIDFLILVAPFIVYLVIALSNENAGNMKKFALTGFTAFALILVIINIFLQKKKTSPRWLMILGLYICIKELLMPLIITLAVVSVMDDFVLKPLINHFRMELIASKTYDKRQKYDKEVSNG